MATYDARPSGFTQLSTTSDWESFMSSAGIWDGIDSQSSFTPALDTVGRNAQIGAGQAIIKGQLWRCDSTVSVPVPAASAQNRLDRLVLRLNRGATSSPNVVAPVIITGTPSGSPTLPPLVQTSTGLYDIPISSWTSASSGALTGLTDMRQFSGRYAISFLSTNPPSPPWPCFGMAVDTGVAYFWNMSNWLYIGPPAQVQQGGNTNNTTSMNAMHAAIGIPAGDVGGLATGPGNTSYRLSCGGHGTQATGTAQAINFQLYAFGQAWATSSDTGNVAAGAPFHWHFTGELLVASSGAGSFFGQMAISQSVASAQGHVTAMDQQVASGIPMGATSMAFQAGWASITGSPTLVCTGAVYERVSRW